ncbi:MAG: hypothetical protein Q7S66_00595 [bacterium]|nr:hypothetical protein [bacterium]
MPTEIPDFSSVPLAGKPVKKRTYRRRASVNTISSTEKKEISKNLTSIYEDQGRLPDMKNIKMRSKGTRLGKLVYLAIFGAILAGTAWFGFFALSPTKQPDDQQITLTIDGPTEITLGEKSNYELNFQNNSNITLKDVVLTVKYPDNFIFDSASVPPDNTGHTEWNVGTIAPYQKGNITIAGSTYGAPAFATSWRVFMNYRPENFNSILQKVATLSTTITRSPISIAVIGPDESATGADSAYQFTFVNSGSWQPAKLELIPSWPNNFYPTSSTPTLANDKKWLIKNNSTAAPGTQTFIIMGKWSGIQNPSTSSAMLDNQPIKVTLNLVQSGINYTIAAAEKTTKLTENTIGLNLAINGSTKDNFGQPGDMLNISLKLGNQSKQAIKKANLKLVIAAPSVKKQSILNWSEIADKYNADIQGKQLTDILRQATLIWTTGNIQELANIKPGQEISVDLRLPIRDIKSFDWANVEGYQITANSEINFTDVNGSVQSVAGNPIIITLNSDLKLESRDTVSVTVDQKEKHDLTWILTNNLHPLKNISISADVFGDVTLTKPKDAPAGDFKFDAVTKKISWTIPDMPESVDVLALPFSITINTSNPTQNTLISKIRVLAEDTVTGQTLDLLSDETALAP